MDICDGFNLRFKVRTIYVRNIVKYIMSEFRCTSDNEKLVCPADSIRQ